MQRGMLAAWAALQGLVLAAAANAASIVSVSPQGEVAQVRQITVKFSESVVPFGDLRLPDPLAVSCQGATPAGSGRWANDKVWLYDFREALPPGTRCTLKVKADWKPSSGDASKPAATLTGTTEFAFNTGGPAIVSSTPYEGAQVEEQPYFLLRLNGPAVESSVLANARCEVDGIGERIGVQVITGAPRDELLKARRIEKAAAERALVLACQRPLPNGAAMKLVWGRGIAAAANPKIATSVEQVLRYTVREAFGAEFSCERERANAPCLPIRPMSLRFSAPVARELAAQVRLKPASGDAIAPKFDKDDSAAEVSTLTFPTPLPENASFEVVIRPR